MNSIAKVFPILLLSIGPSIWAVPIVYEGSHPTPSGDSPGFPAHFDLGVSDGWGPSGVLQLNVALTPAGGTYVPEADAYYYDTFVSVALYVMDGLGGMLDLLRVEGTASGLGSTGAELSMSDEVFLDYVPGGLELLIEGRDTLLDWRVAFLNEESSFEVDSSSEVPEPATLVTLGIGCALAGGSRRLRRRTPTRPRSRSVR